MRRNLRLCLTLSAIALTALVSRPCTVHAQSAQFPSPTCRASVLRLKLVQPSSGWVIIGAAGGDDCAAQRIYWTENNGESWRDITPRRMPTRKIGEVFFLNRSHGWMLSTDALADQENTRFYLLSTRDGGKHWRTLMLQRPMFKLRDDYYFPTQLFFSDSRHGWVLWHWHMMNGSLDALLATADGGQTWKRLADPPGRGPAQFLSASDGWMIGGPEDREGMDSDDIQLWITHDGGASWKPAPVPVPKDSSEEMPSPYLNVFKFKNMDEGMVIAQEQLGPRLFRVSTCRTRDGGKSWQTSQFDAYHARAFFGSNHIFWEIADRAEYDRRGSVKPPEFRFQMDSDPIPFTFPPGVSSESRVFDIDFVDDSNAWASIVDAGQGRLIATTDGGKTFKLMPSPVAQPLSLH